MSLGKKIENPARSRSAEPSSLCFQCSAEVAQTLAGYSCRASNRVMSQQIKFIQISQTVILGSKMSERKSLESSSSKTQYVEIILEFGHKATLKEFPIKVRLHWQ